MRHQAVLGDVVEEFAADAERPAGELDLHLAMRADILDLVLEQAGDMGGSEGAAMVTTARASGIWPAAARTAAPPRLWPIRIAGACRVSRR